MRLIPDFLSHGAEAYGSRGEVGTCARVAKLIEEEFGVSDHESQVSRLLKELGEKPQMSTSGSGKDLRPRRTLTGPPRVADP